MKGVPNMTNMTTQEQEALLNKSRQELKNNFTKIFESKLFWIAAVLILFSFPLLLSFQRPKIQAPPILGQMGTFQLINQDGLPFGNKEIAGSILLVNFVFP